MKAAETLGDVALMAEGYSGVSAAYLGVYKLQYGVMQHGRPTYRQYNPFDARAVTGGEGEGI